MTEPMTRPMTGPRSSAVVLLAATGLGTQVVTAVLLALTARRVEPAEFGHVALALSLAASAALLLDFGTSAYWVREVSAGTMTPAHALASATRKCAVAGALGVLAALAGLGWGVDLLWYVGLLGIATVVYQSSVIRLRWRSRVAALAMVQAAERVLAAALFLVLVVPVGLVASHAFVLAGVASQVSVGVALHLRSLAADGRRDLAVRNPWRGATAFGGMALVGFAQGNDIALLGGLGGAAAAGTYGAVNRWIQPMAVLAGSVTQSMIPSIAAQGSDAQAWRLVRRRSGLLLAAAAVAVVLILGAPWLVPAALGDGYADSVAVLQVLAAASIPAMLNQFLAGALQARRHERFVVRLFAAVIALELLLIALRPDALWAAGAVLVTQVGFGLGLAWRWRRLVRDAAGRAD